MAKMSVKNQKNLIVVGGVVVALLVGTVLLGGFASSEPEANGTTVKEGACPASACGGCPVAQTCGGEKDEGSVCAKTCPADCDKPCCAEKPSEGCCGGPKPCCASEAPTGCGGEPKPTACCASEAEPAVQ